MTVSSPRPNEAYVLYASNPTYMPSGGAIADYGQTSNTPAPKPVEYEIDPVMQELGRRRWMPPFKIAQGLPLINLSARELISGYAGKAIKPKGETTDPGDIEHWLGTLPGVTTQPGYMT